MNILPLVLALMLILSLGAYSLLKESIATHVEERSYLGAMNAESIIRNKLADKQFAEKKEKKAVKGVEKAQEKTLKDITYVSRRSKENMPDSAKLNIALLAGDPSDASYPLLYETSVHLIRNLYEKAPFYKEGLEYQVLDLFIEKAKKDKEATTFAELALSECSLSEVVYKMIKGTNQYTVGTTKGYPPLEDFLVIDRDIKRKPINFCLASKPLLAVVFGDGLTHTIMEEEKRKWEKDHKHHTVKKSDLEQLFLKEGNSEGRAFTEYLPLMGFSQRAPRSHHTRAKDKMTGIKRKIENSASAQKSFDLPAVYGQKNPKVAPTAVDPK